MIFPMIFPLTIFFLMSLLFQLFFLLFLIMSGVQVHIPIYRSWQAPILVLCADLWLSSVLGCQQSFVINRRARFIKPSHHLKLNNNYYMHYFYIILIILNAWSGLSSSKHRPTHCRTTYIDSMRGIIPLHQEESSHCGHMGSIHAIFFCIICIMSILFQIIPIISKIQKCDLGAYSLQKPCQLAQPPLAVSEHTNQEHKGLNHQAPRSLLPLWQLAQLAHRNRTCGCTRAIQSATQSWNYHPMHQLSRQWQCTFPARRDLQFRVLPEPVK